MAGIWAMAAAAGLIGVAAAGMAAPPATAPAQAQAAPDSAPTRVLSARDAARLRGLEGITLQWIGWDRRGEASVITDDKGVWRLAGEQRGEGAARLAVEGAITEIGADYFILHGTITIANTPDDGRVCEQQGSWRFAVTQNRRYYRLRQFEWCDRLTDYVDLYF